MHSFTKFTYFIIFTLPHCSNALLEGLYCGKMNCYEVLGVTRESAKSDIGKAYRQLARKFHPDLHRGDEAKQAAEEKFKLIATAYEILKDDESRTDYDYMLDNPKEFYAHYYRYYRRRVAPKVDVRIVIIVTLTIISIIQYYSGWQRYDSAIKYFSTVPKYRSKALELAKDEINEKINKKGKNRMSKIDQKEELEKIIRNVIEEKMDVKGAYAKPTIFDVIWLQLIMLPYTIAKYIIWNISWIWRFDIMKRPYGRDEKLYIIRRSMGIGLNEFQAIENSQIEEYLDLELWKKENFIAWKQEQDEDMKKILAENPRYKSYRRYMKRHGPSRMTFED